MSTTGDILPSGPLSWEALPDEPLRRVAGFCVGEGLLREARRILVACSGGADSLALVALCAHPRFMGLAGLEPGPELVLGHVDHGLRQGSDEDAAAVARLAEGLGLACVAETLQWLEPASEAEAREARLAALERLAEEVGAEAIVLGHTASDQLETLIMRLQRGCGLRGLAGMAPRRGRFQRPLLCLSGEETRDLVAALGWRPREDATNAGDAFLRNRIRHHVVPLLEAENPRAAQAAFRTAQVLQEELEVLDAVEASTWERLGSHAPGGPSVKVEDLRGLPVGLVARVLRRMWRLVVGEDAQAGIPSRGGELGREHVTQILGLLESDAGTIRADLPRDVVALRTYGRLVLCARRRLEDPGDVEVRIPGPGLYVIEALGQTLEVLDVSLDKSSSSVSEGPTSSSGQGSAQGPEGSTGLGAGSRLNGAAGEVHPSDADSLLLQGLGEAGTWGLRVRNTRPGDRVITGVGHRKVSDLMVDRKIPVPARRRAPILEEAGEILWIPGLYKAPRCLNAQQGSLGEGEGEAGPPTFRLVFRMGQAARPVD